MPQFAGTKQKILEVFIERLDSCATRLRFTLLQLVNGSLRQADASPKLGLAPTKYCPRQTHLRGKGLPLEPHDLPEPARVGGEMNGH